MLQVPARTAGLAKLHRSAWRHGQGRLWAESFKLSESFANLGGELKLEFNPYAESEKLAASIQS